MSPRHRSELSVYVLRRVDARTFVSVDVPPFRTAGSARRWLEREGAAVLAGQRAVIARIVDEVRVDVRQVPRVSLLRAPRPAAATLVPERPPMVLDDGVVEDHVDNGNVPSEDPPP